MQKIGWRKRRLKWRHDMHMLDVRNGSRRTSNLECGLQIGRDEKRCDRFDPAIDSNGLALHLISESKLNQGNSTSRSKLCVKDFGKCSQIGIHGAAKAANGKLDWFSLAVE